MQTIADNEQRKGQLKDYFTWKNPCIYKNIPLVYMYLVSLLIQCVSSYQKSVCFSQKIKPWNCNSLAFLKRAHHRGLWLSIKLHRNTYITHTWEAQGMQNNSCGKLNYSLEIHHSMQSHHQDSSNINPSRNSGRNSHCF